MSALRDSILEQQERDDNDALPNDLEPDFEHLDPQPIRPRKPQQPQSAEPLPF